MEKFFRHDAFAQNLPNTFRIQCDSSQVKSAFDPLKRRDKYFDDLQSMVKTFPGVMPGIELLKDDSYSVGPALKIVRHSIATNKKAPGNPGSATQANQLIFHAMTPDKKQILVIRASSSYPTALEKMIGVEINKMTESIRIIPLESKKAEPISIKTIGANSP